MVDIIAHRGLRHERPENTLEALSEALKLSGIHGVEFDVELTADRQAVVLHQETVVPNVETTGIEPATRNFTSRDWVIESTAEEVLTLDAGSWMGIEFAHVRVPSLKQVLDLAWGETVAYVELKDATFWGKRDSLRPAQVVDAALSELLSFRGNLNIISFNPEILRIMHERAASIPTTLALWTEWQSRVTEAIREAKNCSASTISLPDIILLEDPRWVSLAHEEGLHIHVYPVSPTRGEPEFQNWTAESQIEKWKILSQMGADAIISDFARETLLLIGSNS